MVKRLVYGLVFGLLVGGALGAAVVKGLGMTAFGVGGAGTALAYVFAGLAGTLVGLVAGKPIWAAGGQVEAALKAGFGAVLAAAMMFAMRRWLHVDLNLGSLGLGPAEATEIGSLPIISLPIAAGILGAFYEADNTPENKDGKKDDKAKGGKADDASKKAGAKVRVADPVLDDVDDEVEAPKKAKK
ncbi:hypothetical protein BH09MYX1_BH09MYX1_43740 [soil metagenome]